MLTVFYFVIFFLGMQVVSAAQPIEYVGSVSVNEPLGRIVADPTKPEVYGITSTGDVVFIDCRGRTVQKVISTGRVLRDIDVDSQGRYMYVLDNVTGAYWNQPPAVYVLKYDLASQSAADIKLANAPMYQMALGRTNRWLGVGLNQWVSAYQVNSQTGALLSSADGGYYGSAEWNAQTFVSTSDGNRLFRTEIGISSIDLIAYDTSTDTITKINTRGVGSYSTEPVFINSTDSSLYVGDLRIDPGNISTVLGMFPETIYAATGDNSLAFGTGFVYDPVWGTRLQSMPVNFSMMAIGDNDQYLYSFDTASQKLHIMHVVPEPVSAILLGFGAIFIRRKRQNNQLKISVR